MAVVENINIHPITKRPPPPHRRTTEKSMLISLLLLAFNALFTGPVLCHLRFHFHFQTEISQRGSPNIRYMWSFNGPKWAKAHISFEMLMFIFSNYLTFILRALKAKLDGNWNEARSSSECAWRRRLMFRNLAITFRLTLMPPRHFS